MNAEQRKTARLQTTRLIQVAITTPVYVTADVRQGKARNKSLASLHASRFVDVRQGILSHKS
jgi:hypothetical protein